MLADLPNYLPGAAARDRPRRLFGSPQQAHRSRRRSPQTAYLEAVFQESLRLHPPSASPSKISPPDHTNETTSWWSKIAWRSGSNESKNHSSSYKAEKAELRSQEAPIEVCDYHIPGDTQIGANVPGILKSKDVFSDDAGCFRPERWLAKTGGRSSNEAEVERMGHMRNVLNIVFGASKFHCMGKSIAWMEVRKLFIEVC